MTPRRKVEVLRIRQEGYQAALAGRHRETNPYSTSCMDRLQWFIGYDEFELEQSVADQ